MGRRRKERDPKYHDAASLWLECNRKLTIAEAMLIRGFTKAETDNKSYQKTVLREAKRIGADRFTPIEAPAVPPSVVTDDAKSISSLSDEAAALAADCKTTIESRARPDQVAAKRANWMVEKERYATAFMLATRQYAEEKSKPKDSRMSARQVIQSVTRGFTKLYTPIKVRTVQMYVQQGRIGIPPAWRGPRPAELPQKTFSVLVKAFDSYLQILQFNEDTTGRQFALLLKQIQLVLQPLRRPGISIIYQLLKHTQIDFCLKQASVIEERRSAWSTYENLDMWFNNWKDFLEEKGFGKTVGETFVIEASQLARIVNIDESCLSLNGSSQRRGGRPPKVVSDKRMQLGCLRTSKSSVTVTIICGSSAAGEAVPPHFQFTSTADAENIKIKTDIVEYLPDLRGTFGFEEETTFTCTIAGNQKGGMDNKAFEIYINKNIRALYPDVCDVPGKRLLLKIDGGPGRLNENLLADLAADGIYLYPSLVNNTHISQETDQNYGFFKSIFAENLHKLGEDRARHAKPRSFPWTIVGLLCFGGTDRETGERYRNAHGEAFSKEKNLWAWKKVGAAPLTRACLDDPRIRHASLNDPNHVLYRRVEEANKNACEILGRFGLKGRHLRAKLKVRKEVDLVNTEKGSLERAKVLLEAKSHGMRFLLGKGGCAFNSKDMMVAMELANRRVLASAMEKEKKKKVAHEKTELKALKFLQQEPPIEVSKYKNEHLNMLLEWKGVVCTDQSKETKARNLKVKEKRDFWMTVKDKPSVAVKKWTAGDEAKLRSLKDESKEITMEETAVGRAANRKFLNLFEQHGYEGFLEKAQELHEAKAKGRMSRSGAWLNSEESETSTSTQSDGQSEGHERELTSSAEGTESQLLDQLAVEESSVVEGEELGPEM